ncbi:hypothetical protein Cs7R123_59590 [Catellatospora sp. TT07R-123]|uniref:hypothetical protein n=1 Tax=Catellatospora sp. TT07R-123 TaxID=2733863 RepID=UPI001B0FC80E|nr:hypothetical protein [Catellatospora sp. TT07R-123]GHJ48617.1 hypothetical protein Cs7R123_59590 [Catellatospora sp. TT07R-123]
MVVRGRAESAEECAALAEWYRAEAPTVVAYWTDVAQGEAWPAGALPDAYLSDARAAVAALTVA